jgi:hypothetical protein
MKGRKKVKEKNNMKKYIRKLNIRSKKIAPVLMAAIVIFATATPIIMSTVYAAAFNQGSQPYKMLRSHNFTENGSCSSCWLDDDVTAGIGDIVTFQVFYNNTSDEIAEDVEVKINPSVSSDGDIVNVTARISASNAGSITDSVTIHAKSGEKITGFEQSGDARHEDGLGGSAPISNASNITSGSGIGDIAQGDANSGFVYARFIVIGNDDCNESDAPEVTTGSATNVDIDSATLNCTVNANGSQTNAWFEWGTDINNLNYDTQSVSVGASETNASVSKTITGLNENARYYYRCVGENSEGTDAGIIKNFVTDGNPIPDIYAPEVETLFVTSLDIDSATVNCKVDANGATTNAWFEWGTDSGDLDRTTGSVSVSSSDTSASIYKSITGLSENTRYYYRCVGENSEGTDAGVVRNFTTNEDGSDNGNELSATTLSADNIDTDSARLRCEVDTSVDNADVWFEWGEDSGLDEDTSKVSVSDNETNQTVTKTITSLDEDTGYYFRCRIEDDGGETDTGSTKNFTTDENGGGNNPDVTTVSATGITTNSANLHGEVDPNGEDTDVWFEWGTTTNLNRDTNSDNINGDVNSENFDYNITGLVAGTTYYFRAVAESNEGIDRGSILSFRTNGVVVPPVVPPTIITRIVERIVGVEETVPEGLIVTLDSNKTNISDGEVEYTVTYENLTKETFTNAELTIEIPSELGFVNSSPNEDSSSGNELVYEIGTISPDEKESFTITTELDNNVDTSDLIVFTGTLNYVDSNTNKKIVVIDEFQLGDALRGGGFAAIIADAFRGLFTNPLFWLILIIALIFFVYRYFVSLARPREERVQVIQTPHPVHQQQLPQQI